MPLQCFGTWVRWQHLTLKDSHWSIVAWIARLYVALDRSVWQMNICKSNQVTETLNQPLYCSRLVLFVSFYSPSKVFSPSLSHQNSLCTDVSKLSAFIVPAGSAAASTSASFYWIYIEICFLQILKALTELSKCHPRFWQLSKLLAQKQSHNR